MSEIIGETSQERHGHHHHHQIDILVDGVKHEVRPGPWVVRELKAAVGVPEAKVLADVTPQGLVDLNDDATVHVHEHQRFVSHVRSGGSS